jgi:hypothetical protein
MSEPLRAVDGWGEHADRATGRRLPTRPDVLQPLAALGRWIRAAADRLAGPARMLPGVAAAGCAFAGSLLLWGLGVALLVAAGLLLLVDARTPGGRS